MGFPGALGICEEKAIFSGSLGVLVIIFRDLVSKLIVLGIFGSPAKK